MNILITKSDLKTNFNYNVSTLYQRNEYDKTTGVHTTSLSRKRI